MNNYSNENFFVYIFLDINEKPLYIGITKSLNKRIKNQHFANNSNVPFECLEKVYNVCYHICCNEDDMKIRERYLVNKYNPAFNIKMKNNSNFEYIINFNWVYFPLNKNEILIKKNVKQTKKIIEIENNNLKVHTTIQILERPKANEFEINFSENQHIVSHLENLKHYIITIVRNIVTSIHKIEEEKGYFFVHNRISGNWNEEILKLALEYLSNHEKKFHDYINKKGQISRILSGFLSSLYINEHQNCFGFDLNPFFIQQIADIGCKNMNNYIDNIINNESFSLFFQKIEWEDIK